MNVAGLAYGVQVAGNLQRGQSLGSALTDVDKSEIAKRALLGAVTGATGGLGGPALGFLGGAAIGALSSGGARRRTTCCTGGSGTRGCWPRRR